MAREVLLTGKIKWAKLFKPESYLGGPSKYSLVLYLDPESKAVFQDLKLRNHLKSDEEGYFVTLRREHDPKVFNGKIIPGAEGGPPKVVDKDNQPWPEGTLIGNGSKVSVVLSLFMSRMGAGSRIARVRVEDLVEYNPDTGSNEALPF